MPLESSAELAVGKQFPPERIRYKHDEMERWFRWSQGHWVGLDAKYIGYQGVTTGAITSVNRQRRFDAADNDGLLGWPRLTDNAFQFLMDFWRDAVLEDTPTITGQANEQETIDALMPSLMCAARVVVGDLIRYGVGLFVNRQPNVIQSIDPRHWMPVRPAWDITMGGEDLLAWPYPRTMPSSIDGLVIERYDLANGRINRQLHALESRTIGGPIGEAMVVPGPSVYGVVPVRSCDSEFYGESDYENAAQFVAEIHRRESGISEALDRHVNPHLAVPDNALELQPDGRMRVPSEGMIIPVREDGSMPTYVTWDPRFAFHESACRRA